MDSQDIHLLHENSNKFCNSADPDDAVFMPESGIQLANTGGGVPSVVQDAFTPFRMITKTSDT